MQQDERLRRRFARKSDLGSLTDPIGGEMGKPTPLKLPPKDYVSITPKQSRGDRVQFTEQESAPLDSVERVFQFGKATRSGRDMEPYRKLLARAVGTLVGKREERAVASLFQTGGTHAMKGEFSGINDFEVVAFLVVIAPLPSGPV